MRLDMDMRSLRRPKHTVKPARKRRMNDAVTIQNPMWGVSSREGREKLKSTHQYLT